MQRSNPPNNRYHHHWWHSYWQPCPWPKHDPAPFGNWPPWPFWANSTTLPLRHRTHQPTHIQPNLRMLPQCTPKLCASQAQKGYSPWPISIATPQQLTSLSQKHAHFVSITLCVNFMTTLFPPHPQAILIYPPILFWSAGKILKLHYIYIWSFPMSSSPPTLLTILSYYKYSTSHPHPHQHQTQGNMTHISR
jgi:hypothetical protein